mmetsp:Transcript_30967/g.35371  ORF Transcript_30967/g.35371 Transcript_30967/m.35371 type:complete len:89 (-) Transcript_30967:403-669(-)
MKSFNNMTNYVKNTFRNKKSSGRKHSHYTYSSHRKYDKVGGVSDAHSLKSKTNRRNPGDLFSDPPLSDHSHSNIGDDSKVFVLCNNKD